MIVARWREVMNQRRKRCKVQVRCFRLWRTRTESVVVQSLKSIRKETSSRMRSSQIIIMQMETETGMGISVVTWMRVVIRTMITILRIAVIKWMFVKTSRPRIRFEQEEGAVDRNENSLFTDEGACHLFLHRRRVGWNQFHRRRCSRSMRTHWFRLDVRSKSEDGSTWFTPFELCWDHRLRMLVQVLSHFVAFLRWPFFEFNWPFSFSKRCSCK